MALDRTRAQWNRIRNQLYDGEDRISHTCDWVQEFRDVLVGTAILLTQMETATYRLWVEILVGELVFDRGGDEGRQSPPPAYRDAVRLN